MDSKCSNIRQRSLDRRGRPLPIGRDTSSVVDEAEAAAVVAEMKAELWGFTEQEMAAPCLVSENAVASAAAAAGGGGGGGGGSSGGDWGGEGVASPIHLTLSSGGHGGGEGVSAATTVAASTTSRRSQGGRAGGREGGKKGMTPLRSIGWELTGAGGREGGKAILSSATTTMAKNRVGTRNNTYINGDSSATSSSTMSCTAMTTMDKNNKKKKRKPPLLTSPLSVAAATAASIKAGRERGQWSVPTPAHLRQVADDTGLGLQEVLTVWKKLRDVVRGSM